VVILMISYQVNQIDPTAHIFPYRLQKRIAWTSKPDLSTGVEQIFL